MARMYATLMERLGYKRYFVHATNWGTTIANAMAVLYPDRVAALHFTTCLTAKEIILVQRQLLLPKCRLRAQAFNFLSAQPSLGIGASMCRCVEVIGK